MPEQENTLKELFELAIRLEQAAETLYHSLEARFAHHPQVAAFWARYAREEAGHARQLEVMMSHVEPARLSDPADLHLLDTARDLLSTPVDQLLSRVKNLEDAYRLVSDLENSEVNAIFESLLDVASLEEGSRSFWRAQLHEHIGRLIAGFPPPYNSLQQRIDTQVLE